MRPKHPPRRRVVVRATAALLALVTAACGNRLSTEEIVAQNLPEGYEPGDGFVEGEGGTGAEVATGSASDIAGSADGGADAVGGGGTSGGASSGGSGGGTGPTAAGGSIGTPGETGPIVIGIVATTSGPTGALNTPLTQAVQVWAEHTNANGGLLGRRVQVVRVDDGGDPARHVAALRELVETRKVVAFVGNVSQLAAASGRSFIEQAGVPVIGPSCDVQSLEASPMYFSQCPGFVDLVQNIFRAQVTYGKGRRLAVIYCGEAEPCRSGASLAQSQAPRVGIQIAYVAQTSLAQPDFTSECLNARERGADVMFMSVDPASAIRIADACARQGFFPEFVAGPNTAENAREGRGLEKMLLSVPTFPFVGGQTANAREFERVFTESTGQPTTAYASQGWAAAKMFELAATRAAQASQSVNPKTLVAALRSFDGETLGGLTVPLRFRAGGGVANPSCYWAIRSTPEGWQPLNGPEPLCS